MKSRLQSLMAASPLLLALAAGACATSGDQAALAPPALTPTEQFPIEVRQQPEEIRLAAHPQGLSPAQEEALADLAMRWQSQGGGAITIQAPASGGRPLAVAAAEASRAALVSLGVEPGAVNVTGYEAAPGQPPILRVGFMSYKAYGPLCGGSWESLAANGANEVWANFGCAVTANMAAQVANPRDFLNPRTQGPADATRRSVVLDKYRKGETTAGQVDERGKGTVSDAVKE